MSPDLVGYASSTVLITTIAVQIHRQWRVRSNEGVSPWLFVGQCLASTGFLVYSVLLDSVPFIITNAALSAAALVGLFVYFWTKRVSERERSVAPPRPGASNASPDSIHASARST